MSDEDESMGSSDDEDPYFGYPIEDDDEPEVKDPEYFEYSSLKIENVEMLLNENVGYLKDRLKITPSQAKLLLHMNKWEKELIEEKYLRNRDVLLVDSHLIGANVPQPRTGSAREICPVCYRKQATMRSLSCKEEFCVDCWNVYFEEQIRHGISTGIECMGYKCHILAPEDFILSILRNPDYRLKYQKFAFADYVKSHPQLRFCPGKNCDSIVQAKVPEAKRVECSRCSAMFCFLCGLDYHAPTSCNTIKQWITKCADDSETANYISANTKDCPRCHVCIEKNGGCNHMQCTKCRYEFCWMCLGDWSTHGSEYYECSRYKKNPSVANESSQAKAREALKKYLFYFERWENHAKSLRLEELTMKRIEDHINSKVMHNEGTWIDWQYLLDAGKLLAKARYTLQYTYPYAYYLHEEDRKSLFEHQQAQLEVEIENLSWKIERAVTTDRGDIENQMDIVEKRRKSLLTHFSNN